MKILTKLIFITLFAIIANCLFLSSCKKEKTTFYTSLLYAKTDWTVWTASLNSDRRKFRNFILPLYRFMNETTDRVPMADLINTDKAFIAGFSNRPVVGAYFIRLLEKKIGKELDK